MLGDNIRSGMWQADHGTVTSTKSQTPGWIPWPGGMKANMPQINEKVNPIRCSKGCPLTGTWCTHGGR